MIIKKIFKFLIKILKELIYSFCIGFGFIIFVIIIPSIVFYYYDMWFGIEVGVAMLSMTLVFMFALAIHLSVKFKL